MSYYEYINSHPHAWFYVGLIVFFFMYRVIRGQDKTIDRITAERDQAFDLVEKRDEQIKEIKQKYEYYKKTYPKSVDASELAMLRDQVEIYKHLLAKRDHQLKGWQEWKDRYEIKKAD